MQLLPNFKCVATYIAKFKIMLNFYSTVRINQFYFKLCSEYDLMIYSAKFMQ